jgi:hypothetical protein
MLMNGSNESITHQTFSLFFKAFTDIVTVIQR